MTNALHLIDSKLFLYVFLSESTNSLLHHDFYVPTLYKHCITSSSSLSKEEVKLFAIVN